MIRSTIIAAAFIAALPAFAQPAIKKGTVYEEVTKKLAAGFK